MNHIPTFEKGKVITANNLNKLGDGLRYNTSVLNNGNNTNRHKRKPFDIISMRRNSDGQWEFILEPAIYYEIGDTPIPIYYGLELLTDHPKIVVPGLKDVSEHNLVFNYSSNKIGWQLKTQPYNLLIIEPEYLTGGGVILHNRWNNHVDLRNAPPFMALVTNEGYGAIKVGCTPGLVIERIVTEDDCVLAWTPDNMIDSGRIQFHDITDTQQYSVVFPTTDEGDISDTPYMVVETNDTESIHYQPKTADESAGTDGEYHYPLVKSGGANKHMEKSHIYYDEDIDQVNNCLDPQPGAANEGRIVKEWDEAESRWNLRRIKTDSPQIVVTEEANYVNVKGNGNQGSAVVKVNGVDAGPTLDWQDGLITDNANVTWNVTIPALSSYVEALSGGTGDLDYQIGSDTAISLIDWVDGSVQDDGNSVIPIPKLQAGTNIQIIDIGNVHTINCTASTECNCLTAYEETQLYVCIAGVPTLKTFLTKI